jgi:hypothetical protein
MVTTKSGEVEGTGWVLCVLQHHCMRWRQDQKTCCLQNHGTVLPTGQVSLPIKLTQRVLSKDCRGWFCIRSFDLSIADQRS